ncbi:MAG: hypothetical protein OMM_09175 [Candidatus Magnetoglobus multicellularis str. Araruama]|uniref:PilZ domain-containing protein n=1 Tax=Candidatus Magnetoglobus multicellularis str. Araruama TaxID=890399 RepID=A0A1V1P553_9BACT|nr:MAG: hypothetical protein OMM_09175 [Candidatus Magnetoglobus multicellularis str. Araruama]
MSNNEKRREKRFEINQYYSVEFLINGLGCLYQCKLWNISKKGMCILVKNDSPVLEYYKVGDVLNMRYYEEDSNIPTKYLKTQIKHISQDGAERFKGHKFVGLYILEGQHSISIPV